MTHGYIRHGTTTLFAALNVFEGPAIGQWHGQGPAICYRPRTAIRAQ